MVAVAIEGGRGVLADCGGPSARRFPERAKHRLQLEV